jgi:hypothetical protein
MSRHPLPIALLLSVLCSYAEANIGIVQIYRASHWMGVVALVLAVLVEGQALGRWLHPGPGGSSVRDRAFWVATAANFACVVLGYVFPSVNSNELSSYLGTQGVMGRHLLAFVGLWVVFSVLVEVPIAVLLTPLALALWPTAALLSPWPIECPADWTARVHALLSATELGRVR